MKRSWGMNGGLRDVLRNVMHALPIAAGAGRVLAAASFGEGSSRSFSRAKPRGGVLLAQLLLIGLVLAMAAPAQAANSCSDYRGVIDGNDPQFQPPPTNIEIDTNCTIRNFQDPNPLISNFNFYTAPGQTSVRYLVVFDNVNHTGNMSCNATHEHKIWFTNGSSTKIQDGCQNLLIPVEKIDKQNPGAYVSVGVPFTYTMTIPVLYDPGTGGVINSSGSVNELHGITLTDDLNALGVDVTYLDHRIYWRDSGSQISEYSFSNDAGLLTWTFDPGFTVPAGEQFLIELDLVLDDTPTNVLGTQFVNTAKWEFGRLIDGTFYDPLPGEWGVTEPLTIAAPELVVTKSGPATLGSTLNLGDSGDYSIDVTNVGLSSAHNVVIADQLPSADLASMCDTDPTASVGVSLGGALLTVDTDYTVTWQGDPACRLEVNLINGLSIAPGESLVIDYTTQLDDDVDDGSTLTNIVAATQWTSDADPDLGSEFGCALTDGTPDVADCQDAHSVLAVFSGYFFDKVAYDPVTGERKTTALPGETVEYRVRVRSVDEGVVYARITDDMGSLNGTAAVYEPGSFEFIGIDYVEGGPPAPAPAPAVVNNSDPTGGTNGDPLLDIRNFEIAPETVREIVFRVTLADNLSEGQEITNQAQLYLADTLLANSNDPNVVGPINVAEPQREPDPTVITINFPPPTAPLKTSNQVTATIGEEVVYTITVPGTVEDRSLYEVEITDVLDPNLEYVDATVSGVDPTLVSNTSTASELQIAIAEIPAGEQAVIELRARVRNIETARQGLIIENIAAYTYTNLPGGVRYPPLSSAAVPIELFEPYIEQVVKTPSLTTPTGGETLRYSVTLTATGGINPDVFDVTLIDTLDLGLVYAGNPAVTVGEAGTVGADNSIGEPVITGDGIDTPQTLVWGPPHANADIDIAGGAEVTISYDVRVLDSVLANQELTNTVVARWTSLDGVSEYERDGSDGFDGGINDYETEPVTAAVATPNLAATVAKARISDTFGASDADLRIGDIVDYELRVTMPEGTLGNVTLTDTLPQGLDYVEIVSINGQAGPTYGAVAPFSHADLTDANVSADGDPVTGPTTVTWTLGAVANLPNDGASDDFVIVYRARVINGALVQANTTPLENSVELDYDTAAGPAPTQNATASVTVLQPNLVASKSSDPVSGSVVAAGDTVTYTVTLENTGTAPAYDVVLEDVIPLGMRDGGVTVVNTALASGALLPTRDYSSYDPATGVVVWDFDSGVADEYSIPSGDALVVVYQVQVDADIGVGQTLTNQAQAATYYSLDDEAVPALGGATGEREIYGPSNTASTSLYTTAPPAKVLVSPADGTATIGEDVVYEITVPEAPLGLPIDNVVITDTLDARLSYQGYTQSGGPAVTDNSSGNDLNFTVAQIPAGEQVTLQVTARVLNVEAAQAGDAIANSAAYSFDGAGAPIPSQPVTVDLVEPALTMTKDVANITDPGQPAEGGDTLEYSLTVTNASTEIAYDTNVTDMLPDGLTLVADSATAEINGVPVAGFNPAPTQVAPNTLIWGQGNGDESLDIPPAGTLVLTYRVTVDAINAASIDNTAWVDWTSLDTALAPRERTGEGCPTTAAPNDYCFGPATATIAADSQLAAEKTVFNVTTGQSGETARPGHTLRYTIAIENTGTVAVSGVSLLDEIDALNDAPMFVAGSLSITGVPAGATDASDPNGGAAGTGLVDVSDISLDPAEVVTVEFELTLIPVIDGGTLVYNQGAVSLNGVELLLTDEPALAGTEDPTQTLIESVPDWTVEKVSQYLGDDPAVLLAGDQLRYTITVRNTGTEDAIDVVFQDTIPVNTTYVGSSTTLNGAPVGDPSGGVSAVEAGMLINAPVDPTPGSMP
ncbi:MAG TPA: DUF11 domain-containing protein, partial [Thioalkalivibrio sp.]|nr:DUF11 domain-containing protein [Thioalkalivibrio sp.]